MELKEEYKNVDIKEILINNLQVGDFAKVNGEVTAENIDKLNKSIELIKQNNWEEIYITLYYLLDEMSKKHLKLKVKSTADGAIGMIQDISIVVFTALSVNNDGKFKELSIGIIADEFNRYNVIIETSEKETVTDILNTICTDWKDTFIIADEEPKKDKINIVIS